MASTTRSGSSSTGTVTDPKATSRTDVPKDYMVSLISQFLSENQIPVDDVVHEMVRQDSIRRITSDNYAANESTTDIAECCKTDRWDLVIENVQNLTGLSEDAKYIVGHIYEHIFRSLVHADMIEPATKLLENAPILSEFLKRDDPDRYDTMIKIRDKIKPAFDHNEDEEQARAYLASRVQDWIRTHPASKKKQKHVLVSGGLLSMLQDALKWRKLVSGGRILKYDWLVNNEDDASQKDDEQSKRKRSKLSESIVDIDLEKPFGLHAKFGKGVSVQAAAITYDGETIATGTSDGFVELWHAKTLKLRKDLEYQANEEPLFTDAAVVSLCFSITNELLACGDVDGRVRVFRVKDGGIAKQIETGHARGGVTAFCFSPDEKKISTAGIEGPVRIFSLATGARLCECIGHDSFVNSVAFVSPTRLITAASDETVRLWSTSGGEQVKVISPNSGKVCRVIPHKPFSALAPIDGPPCYVQYGEMTHIYVCTAGRIVSLALETFQSTTIITAPANTSFLDLSISKSGNILVVICSDGAVLLHELQTKRTRTVKKEPLLKAIHSKSAPELRYAIGHPDEEMTFSLVWSNSLATFC